MTKEEAEKKIKELQYEYSRIEDEMVELALEHNIPLELDGRGSLILEEDDWTRKSRGDWYTSTDSCS